MNLGKRALQVAKIGLAARRIAKARTASDKTQAREALAALFSDAKGVTMKVGQLLAGQAGDGEYTDLVTSIEPLPLTEIEPLIAENLGHPVTDIFSDLDESQAAASLGQVHHAHLTDGREVAVKVRYPGIAEAVDAELKLAGLMPGLGPVKKWGFDLDGYKTTLKSNMDRELDYTSEAARQTEFAEKVQVPGLVVPKIHADVLAEGVLVQDWQSGLRLSEITGWPERDRKSVARILLGTLLCSLFEAGRVHGDPHPGNSYYRKTTRGQVEVVLMDYGCIVDVDDSARLALLKMIISLREGQPVDVLQAFAAMGFEAEKLALIAEPLAAVADVLLLPFLHDGEFDFANWNLKNRFETLLGENRWWFRSAGPPSLLLLLRAFQGLVQQLEQLQVNVDWGQVLMDHVSLKTRTLATNMSLPPLPEGLSVAHIAATTPKEAAAHLKVLVTRDAEQIVEVTMPGRAARNIENLMPEDVLAQITATGDIDIEEIKKRLKDTGLCPQDIFDFDNGEKRYRVWLE
jgi:predicted unusual protein kinase regulating ubiquinone biosynthesis (AarF/ABC1/UbiB family)